MSDIYITILISGLESLNSPTKSRLSEIHFSVYYLRGSMTKLA